MPVPLIALCALSACVDRVPDDAIVLGAAANLSIVLAELVNAYAQETGDAVRTTIGSSGQLAQQIRQGAPIDVFMAADVESVNALAAENRLQPGSVRVYARGRLAIWSRDTAAAIERIEDLASPGMGRIAIANPEFAPYGRAARESMTAAGVWDAVSERVVIAENVQQALQFAETGNADVALVAYSLVHEAGGRSILVPGTLHAPLDQALGVVAGPDSARAARFAAFVMGGAGRAILERYGFAVPERP
jgi:molybdate transport system substrate-binding protein